MHELGLCGCVASPVAVTSPPVTPIAAKRTKRAKRQDEAAAAPAPTADVALPVPVLEHELATVLHGDSLRLLEAVAPNSVDAVVTDPPAGIGFMGEEWDDYRRAANENDANRDSAFGRLSRSGPEYGRDEAGFIAAMTPIFAAAFAALKPGGHGVFWAIPRTSDWTLRALRAAGFETRDQVLDLLAADELLAIFLESLDGEQLQAFIRIVESQSSPYLYWLYGQGMPKSHAHLKPAAEHWILVRKPCDGSAKANVKRWGTGELNIDEARIGVDWNTDPNRRGWQGGNTAAGARGMWGSLAAERVAQPDAGGRWPANVTLEHAPGCDLVGTSTEDRLLREPAGEVADATYRGGRPSSRAVGSEPVTQDVYCCAPGCPVAALDAQAGTRRTGGRRAGQPRGENAVFGKSGGSVANEDVPPSVGVASRFFFCAKPGNSEKRAGLEDTAAKHPTVKPLGLMRWLVRLVTPAGGLVLDPFAGSGTTLVAALQEGRRVIGIERESKYLPIVLGRVRHQLSGFAAQGTPVASGA
jgi:site-specific DNA-methyltransferase (adenine-specific)